MTVEKEPRRITVRFGLPLPEFPRAGQFKLEMMHLLGVQPEDLESHLPIVGADYLYVPIRRLHTLFELRAELPGARTVPREQGVSAGCACSSPKRSNGRPPSTPASSRRIRVSTKTR